MASKEDRILCDSMSRESAGLLDAENFAVVEE